MFSAIPIKIPMGIFRGVGYWQSDSEVYQEDQPYKVKE